MSNHDLCSRNKEFTLASWTPQEAWNPISMVRAKGVYFWDGDGKRYLDWSSQLLNVNVGHGHPHVIKAIQDQASCFSYAYPGIATEPRARLGEMLREITPASLSKTFFTAGGADAIENAMKICRLYTGRQKIFSRYRSYHGGTFGAMSAGGDPRRLANEPGIPWVVHIHDPYPYRSPLYRGRSQEEGDQALIDQIEETLLIEGPNNVAAILLEGYSGTSGILQGGQTFWRGIQNLKEKYAVPLIIDEVLSGFGRTGKWFGVDHYPFVQPDVIVLAKGLTSGYVPMGAVVVSDEVASYFDKNTLWCGLTYSGHPLSCAAAIANLEVYKNEDLIDRAAEMGVLLREQLMELSERHPSIGDIRGTGLHFVVELVKNRESREPMSAFNQPLSPPMQEVAQVLRTEGLSTFVRWNWIFCAPPLVIEKPELKEGLEIISLALEKADQAIS